jgi:hypothetical protein
VYPHAFLTLPIEPPRRDPEVEQKPQDCEDRVGGGYRPEFRVGIGRPKHAELKSALQGFRWLVATALRIVRPDVRRR